MDRGALDDALESGGWNSLGAFDIGDQSGEVIVDEVDKGFAQLRQVNRTGFHHPGCVRFVYQRQKQMFQRGEFVAACVGQCQGTMDCLLKRRGK